MNYVADSFREDEVSLRGNDLGQQKMPRVAYLVQYTITKY